MFFISFLRGIALLFLLVVVGEFPSLIFSKIPLSLSLLSLSLSLQPLLLLLATTHTIPVLSIYLFICVFLSQAKLEAYVEAKKNGTRHVDVLLKRRERCLREILSLSSKSTTPSFSKKGDCVSSSAEEENGIEFGSMIQLLNGASNFKDAMELYPADCDFAKKKTGLEKMEHECTVAPSPSEEGANATPNAKNTFFVRRGSRRRNDSNGGSSSSNNSNRNDIRNDEEVVRFGDRIILSANPLLFDEEDEEAPELENYSIKDLVCSTVSKEYNDYLYGGRKNAVARKTFTVFRESNLARENEFEIVSLRSVGNNKNASSASVVGEERQPPVKTNDAFMLKHCGRGGYLRCLDHENWPTPDFGVVKPVVSDENDALLSKRRFDASYLWRFRAF